MITGAQIGQARELLGWPPSRLAQRAKVHSAIVRRAESREGCAADRAFPREFFCGENSRGQHFWWLQTVPPD
jgi:hypothetical protein